MTTTGADASEKLFRALAEDLLRLPGVTRGTMMGYPCLRSNDAFFACTEPSTGHLVVKLPADRVGELVAAGEALPFAPNGGTFREWAAFPHPRPRRMARTARRSPHVRRRLNPRYITGASRASLGSGSWWPAGCWGDEVADLVGLAVGGVECAGSLFEALEVAAQGLEGGDALVDLGFAALEQFGDVAAGGFAAVAQGDDLADLAQGEADRLRGPDEDQPGNHGVVVVAVARRCAGGWGEHADVFVVADGLDGDSGPVGQFADAHDWQRTS